MSENETSLTGSEDKTKPNMDVKNTENNINLFHKMVKICRNNKEIPSQYVEDMIKMHKNCSIEKQNSRRLYKLIIEAIEYIPGNKKAFQYVANLYNEFLRLTKKDLTNLQVENCVASTSNGSANVSLEVDNVEGSNEISESTKIFSELIKKCYANSNFPKSNIEVIDKLYRSLPSEFLDTKHFLQLLNESNQAIWPDSSASLYVYVEHVYNQLLQFETSMKAQDRKMLEENNEANIKKYKTICKLKKALKAARKQIKYLEEKEMDINSEEEFDVNSPYILKDKYEKRVIEIYKKICKITNEPDFLGESELRFNETNDKLVNKAIQKYYNLNKTFPDYYEIYTLLKLLREKKKLDWTESELKNISQDAFLKLGKKLKLKRLNEYFGRISYVTTVPDPAENDLELKKKLDESNRKLHADLNAVAEKYNNMQDYAEETDGSSLNNTDCENSSDDSCSNNNSFPCKKFKSTNFIPIKHKKLLSNKSEENEPPKKSQKTIYMESFNLTPCSVTLEPLNDMVNDEINNDIEKVQSRKTSDKSNKVNVNIVTEENKNNEGLGSDNSALEESFVDTDGDGALVIDESIQVSNDTNEIIPRKPQENEVQKVRNKEQTMDINTISIDSEDYDPIITEPEVIIHESEGLKKDVIEINELDDSDVEITSCDTPKVPVQNKKSLESIIKSSMFKLNLGRFLSKVNFDKKYNWNQRPPSQKTSSLRPSGQKLPNQRPSSQRPPSQRPPNQRPPILWPPSQRPSNSIPSHGLHNQHPYNNDQNTSNHNLVNCWIIHNQQPHRSNNNNRLRPPFNSRLSSANQRMQSTIHRNTTERQVTQRFSNSVQQQSNFLNNQSIIQQRVTTMTTTTMVRQIVQQPAESSGRRQLNTTNQNTRPVSVQSETNGNPELIELD